MQRDPDILGLVLDELADRIAARIATVREREVYTSLELPPHVTRRRFAEVCRSGRVLGATRDGDIWTCTRSAWDTARRRATQATQAPPATPSAGASSTDKTAVADRLLERAGLRVVGSRR